LEHSFALYAYKNEETKIERNRNNGILIVVVITVIKRSLVRRTKKLD